MAHSTILRMILVNTHLDILMENLSNRRSKPLMGLLEEPTSMLMLMALSKQSTTLLMPLDSELEPPTSLSIMLRDLLLNLSKKSKQLRSQLLLLTKVPWSPLLTIATFPMPQAMVTTSQHLMLLLHLLLLERKKNDDGLYLV